MAADMPDPATRQEKQARFDRLLETQNRISREINDGMLGKTVRVLVDGYSSDDSYRLTSRTEDFKLVYVKGDGQDMGKFLDVKIEKSSTWALFGARVEDER